MLDQDTIDLLRLQLTERFTAADLVEMMDLSPGDIVDRFLDEVLETDWSEHL